ncbi:hypothetical protein C8R43DRAFT_883954 [Mycena crocata]|nr:hypothetical protein C8R43DRAFT_904527 [Mycena crocata]KAJ7156429.1 hypothetical protein C8R43DRAFT_883954 [Mycena crocata]
MRPGEDENFLRFSTALKILVGSAIEVHGPNGEGLPRARSLLQEYLLGFSRLYGPDQMKPNHHWSVHIPDQILDFGPVYTFWAFLTERLNKILKNLNSNNWTGGRLEVSMMREFHRSSGIDGVMDSVVKDSPDEMERIFCQKLLDANRTRTIGTIQDASQDATVHVRLGAVSNKAEKLSDFMMFGLKQYYNKVARQVHFPREASVNTTELHSYAETYSFALLDGRRIAPASSHRNSGGSCLIQAKFGDPPQTGEIRSIFVHRQPGVPNSAGTLLASVAWMKESIFTPLDNAELWNKFPELGINTWELDTYIEPRNTTFPMIIRVEDIDCQVARGRVTHTQPPMWITTSMARVSCRAIDWV